MLAKVTKNFPFSIQTRTARMTTKQVVKMTRKKERTSSTKRTCLTLSLRMLRMRGMKNSLTLAKMATRLSMVVRMDPKARSCQQQKASLRARKKAGRRNPAALLLLMRSLHICWMATPTRKRRRNI